MITEEKDIPRKSYDEILKYVKDVCKKNENKYMRLTNFTRDHYLNYLKRVLKDNFKVYNEKEKYINNFNYDDMEYDKLFMEIAKEMEEKASRACMILEPYRFEMLRMIYEINCNSNNFQLSFNVSRLEQLHNHTDSSYCESNNCSQFKIHNVYKDMEKLFNEHSINDSLNIDNLVNQYNNNNTNVVTNTTDAIKSSTNCSNIVPSFETTDDLFIEQFLYYMENNENVNLKFNQKDEHNQKYWYSEMLYQRRLFKNALSKIKYVSNIDNHKSSLNTYQKILDTIYEIFGSSSDVEDYDYEDEDDNNASSS